MPMPMMPGGSGAPGMNPNLAMFAQMAQQQGRPLGASAQPLGGGQPQGPMQPPMPPQGPVGPSPAGGAGPQGMPPGVPPQRPPGAPQGAGGLPPGINPQILQALMAQRGGAPGAQQPQGQQQGPPRMTVQQMASAGRNGDQVMAHLTPGEIEVPPQVQTPKVLATLKHAFQQAHVNPQQFTAGSPQSSRNPVTGAPEYNFLSAALAALGAGAGYLFAPETLGLSIPAGMALGGGLGGAAGSALSGGSMMQDLIGGGLGAAGGYFGGNLLGSTAAGPMLSGAAGYAVPSLAGGIGGAALGGMLGGVLDPNASAASANPTYPPGFNTPLPTPGSLGNVNQLLGTGGVPTVAQAGVLGPQMPVFPPGYNPYQAGAVGGTNFFPNGA